MKKRILSLLLVVAMLMTLSINVFAEGEKTNAKGTLFIVGGALASTNQEVYDKFIELAGGKEKAKIGVIPAASGNLNSSKSFIKDLIQYGVPEENLVLLPIAVRDDSKTKDVDESTWIENSKKQEVADKIKGLTGVWFVGGDQTRITKAMLNADGSSTVALDAMWAMYKNGGVIGGTSAGAAIMSTPMLAGGTSLGAINNGFTTTYGDQNSQLSGPAYVEAGLGFFEYGIVDQHFDARARLGRLIVTSYEYRDKYSMGFGIDEDTAMIYYGSTNTIEVIGKGGVTIVDISKAVKDDRSKQLSMKNVILNFIEPGDKFNAETKDYTISDTKDLTNGYEYYYVPGPIISTGVFSGYNQVKEFIMYNLVDNEAVAEIKSYCYDENGIGAELLFKKTAETKGYWGYRNGNQDGYSATGVVLDIKPVRVTIKDAYLEYTVKTGEALHQIAKKFKVSIGELLKLNNLKNVTAIKPGQVILIPQE